MMSGLRLGRRSLPWCHRILRRLPGVLPGTAALLFSAIASPSANGAEDSGGEGAISLVFRLGDAVPGASGDSENVRSITLCASGSLTRLDIGGISVITDSKHQRATVLLHNARTAIEIFYPGAGQDSGGVEWMATGRTETISGRICGEHKIRGVQPDETSAAAVWIAMDHPCNDELVRHGDQVLAVLGAVLGGATRMGANGLPGAPMRVIPAAREATLRPAAIWTLETLQCDPARDSVFRVPDGYGVNSLTKSVWPSFGSIP